MRAALLLLLAACPARSTTTTPGDRSPRPGWSARVAITIKLPNKAPLGDFPVPIRLAPGRVDYARIAPDGHDLRFTDAAGVDLPFEVEHFEPGKTSWVWVRIPKAMPGVDTKLELYFDAAKAPYLSVGETRVVWRNGFDAVYHLAEIEDSSPNQSSTNGVGMTPADGVVGPARFFSPKNADSITAKPPVIPGDRTLCVWASSDLVEPGLRTIAGYDTFAIARDGAAATCGGATAPDAFAVGAFKYVCCVHRGGTDTVFVDGVASATTGRSGDALANPFKIGGGAVPTARWAGVVDEVRVSNVARDGDWITSEVASMKTDVATFGAIEQL